MLRDYKDVKDKDDWSDREWRTALPSNYLSPQPLQFDAPELVNEPAERPCFREIKETLCEILMEERREGDETMSRENRRVAAISWSWTGSAGNGENLPPPKPSRVPAAYVGIGGSAGKSVTSASSDAIAFWTNDVPSGAQQRSFGATDARQ
ncbi:hypothetical protein DAPPUDRAFT_324467 [Daphnia pulex]|uniref:Uncharacterized protein n=1 Tax=Daphnia pulex TaxID=6669 RepID=E9H1T7_DAPPU|nr:hypothetical protein DAPPUDRAFT_324467 [Daphnia pulex]|eukprot:EFX74229.1 hypothetical protein DAPPUDRAFT_324467 [Daphnia pulex]